MGLESIPQPDIEPKKEHTPPFMREEGKIMERIDAQEKLKQIIDFPDSDKKNITPYDIIYAAKNYLEKLGGVDDEKAKELNALIQAAEEVLDKKRTDSAKERFKSVNVMKFHDPRKERRQKPKYY